MGFFRLGQNNTGGVALVTSDHDKLRTLQYCDERRHKTIHEAPSNTLMAPDCCKLAMKAGRGASQDIPSSKVHNVGSSLV